MPSQTSLLSGPGGGRLGAPHPPYMNGANRVPSMAGLSMWGGGSVYDAPQHPGFSQPNLTGMSGSPSMMPMGMGMPTNPNAPVNPFESPVPPMVDPRQSGFYSPYPAQPSMLGMGAPRGSVMTNLGGFSGGGGGVQQGGMPRGMSTYSLATTNHPLAPLPSVNEASNPGDEEVLSVLKRYLAAQDLMSV